MRGLRPKPKYEDLIGVAVSDKLYNVIPKSWCTVFTTWFGFSQLDGEGMRAMETQQEMASKEAFKQVY